MYDHLDQILDRLQEIESGMESAERRISRRRTGLIESDDVTRVQGITSDAFQLRAARSTFQFPADTKIQAADLMPFGTTSTATMGEGESGNAMDESVTQPEYERLLGIFFQEINSFYPMFEYEKLVDKRHLLGAREVFLETKGKPNAIRVLSSAIIKLVIACVLLIEADADIKRTPMASQHYTEVWTATAAVCAAGHWSMELIYSYTLNCYLSISY